MKLKKFLSLFVVIGMILTLTPFPAIADAEETRTMEITVNAGESISVWNTNIAGSGVTSNTVTVLVENGTDYDIVFPEGSGTAARRAINITQFFLKNAATPILNISSPVQIPSHYNSYSLLFQQKTKNFKKIPALPCGKTGIFKR